MNLFDERDRSIGHVTKTKAMEHCLKLPLIVFTVWLVTYSTDYSKSKNSSKCLLSASFHGTYTMD